MIAICAQPPSARTLAGPTPPDAERVVTPDLYREIAARGTVTGAAAPPENPKKFSFLVRGPAARFPNGYVPGKITFPAPNIAQFDIEASDAEIFPAGDYRLTLFGVADPTPGIARPAIIAADLGKLDGKPSTLPSGDGTPGDNFDCKFGVA